MRRRIASVYTFQVGGVPVFPILKGEAYYFASDIDAFSPELIGPRRAILVPEDRAVIASKKIPLSTNRLIYCSALHIRNPKSANHALIHIYTLDANDVIRLIKSLPDDLLPSAPDVGYTCVVSFHARSRHTIKVAVAAVSSLGKPLDFRAPKRRPHYSERGTMLTYKVEFCPPKIRYTDFNQVRFGELCMPHFDKRDF
ncbi:hypothetical protein EBR96_05055 [bacterium]|nr:hypothetical protein [bacterium]